MLTGKIAGRHLDVVIVDDPIPPSINCRCIPHPVLATKKLSLAEFFARRELALDYLAYWLVNGTPVEIEPYNRVLRALGWAGLRLGPFGHHLPTVPPRDKTPLPLP